jgi:glycolate oxidase FAD binding subunit
MADISAHSIEQLQQIVCSADRVLPHGGRSKSALSTNGEGTTLLDLRGLSGILEYEPGEYTITAQAGTSLAEVQAALAENGQYLPFDPPLVEAGATLGGTIAAGLSGSGRYRYGGVRDFLIGIRFVDGQGRVVRGGGKVVKNAAGFDLPKLMAGSLGRFGVLAEVTFKVFPRPQTYASVCIDYPTLTDALAAMHQVANVRMDIDALDIAVTPSHYQLWVRLGGWETILPQRLAQVRSLLGAGDEVSGQAEQAAWHVWQEFTWAPATEALVKVATTAALLPKLDEILHQAGAQRHYAVGGNLAWIAWPGALTLLDQHLRDLHLSGLVLRGETEHPWIGRPLNNVFMQRIKQSLDPDGRFGAL